MFYFCCYHSDKGLIYSKLIFEIWRIKQNALWHNLGLCEMCFADQRAQSYTDKKYYVHLHYYFVYKNLPCIFIFSINNKIFVHAAKVSDFVFMKST